MGSCVNSLLLRLAVSLVRGWTRAYTWRMPAELGESWVLPGWFSRPAPSGRTRLVECANSSAPPQTTAEFRTRVITCAGLFFTPGRDDEARIRRP
jgi:hypothetical protein